MNQGKHWSFKEIFTFVPHSQPLHHWRNVFTGTATKHIIQDLHLFFWQWNQLTLFVVRHKPFFFFVFQSNLCMKFLVWAKKKKREKPILTVDQTINIWWHVQVSFLFICWFYLAAIVNGGGKHCLLMYMKAMRRTVGFILTKDLFLQVFLFFFYGASDDRYSAMNPLMSFIRLQNCIFLISLL